MVAKLRIQLHKQETLQIKEDSAEAHGWLAKCLLDWQLQRIREEGVGGEGLNVAEQAHVADELRLGSKSLRLGGGDGGDAYHLCVAKQQMSRCPQAKTSPAAQVEPFNSLMRC